MKVNLHHQDFRCKYTILSKVSVFVDVMVFLSRKLGTNLEVKMSKYPRMRLKRGVIFGFTDVLGMYGIYNQYITINRLLP
jgi:hypothetical protein